MNGRTTVISKAAAMAVRKGIVVVNCAGNDGLNGQHNTLNAPADADSVISVGAVDVTGTRASFSSIGPTTSIPPRVKPDVMARGTSVYVASTTNPTGYIYDQGTSFSCPLAAGVAALILHADSQATPFDVANAMRSTASRANAPDNLYGWGIIDALAAINFLSAPDTGDNRKPNAYILEQNYPNPFNPYTIIRFFVPQEGFVSLEVFNILGEEIQVLVSGVKIAGIHEVRFDGSELPSGVYYYKISAGSFLETKKMVLVK
jgi:subtilisin family serine protease